MTFHPVHRVVALLLFAVALPWFGRGVLLTLCITLLLLTLREGRDAVRRLLGLLRRTRLLLLTVLVLHLWVTPGAPWWPEAPLWMPSVAGTWLGFDRVLLLLTNLVAVNLLLVTTPVDALVGALTVLARPLTPFGIAPARLARRIGLTLDMLAATGEAVAEARRGMRGPRDWRDALAELVLRAERAGPPATARTEP